MKKEEAEEKLNVFIGVYERYEEGKLKSNENKIIKKFQRYIKDIADEENINLDQNISDEQINILLQELENRSSHELGWGKDAVEASELLGPYALFGLIVYIADIENCQDLLKYILGHHAFIKFLETSKEIILAKIKL